MAINKITITQADKYQTVVFPYFTEKEPLGSILILHGMAEHYERYLPFARFLNDNGYDVFLYNHRGHGKDTKFEDLGHFDDRDGSEKVIGDAISVLRYVKENNRGSRTILFGHSMGSLIARNVIQRFDDIDACVICGTAHMPPIASRFGMMLASLIKTFKGPRYRSTLINDIAVGYKDFAKISNRTSFDWLTRNDNIVGAYISDPYCGYLCTCSFFYDMIRFTYRAALPKLIKKTRRDLNIFIISGSHDPVGSYGKGIASLFASLQKYGFTNVDCTVYEDCRHELLNELNSDEVMHDVLDWINRCTAPKTE